MVENALKLRDLPSKNDEEKIEKMTKNAGTVQLF